MQNFEVVDEVENPVIFEVVDEVAKGHFADNSHNCQKPKKKLARVLSVVKVVVVVTRECQTPKKKLARVLSVVKVVVVVYRER